jgi:antitoxin ParD1/3/4
VSSHAACRHAAAWVGSRVPRVILFTCNGSLEGAISFAARISRIPSAAQSPEGGDGGTRSFGLRQRLLVAQLQQVAVGIQYLDQADDATFVSGKRVLGVADIAISCHLIHDSRMESMNISLPEPLRQFVDGQIATGRYSSASEYVRELIREDEKRKAQERLKALLLEGLQGEETELTHEDWAAIRKEAQARLGANKKRK